MQAQRLLVVILILAAHLLTNAPANADSRWTVRGNGSFWAGISDQATVIRTSPEGAEEQAIHSVSDGSSFGLSLEFVVKRRLGFEFGFLIGGIDTDFNVDTTAGRLADSDSFDLYATTVGLNYHFSPGKRADIYLGAFVQQSNYSDVTFLTIGGRSRTLSFDDDYGAGLKIGIDRPFKPDGKWIFTADVRFVATILESEQPNEDLDLHPTILSIGVGYRF